MNSMILGRYVPGNSILHRMDPRAKLLGLFLLIVILFFHPIYLHSFFYDPFMQKYKRKATEINQ